MCSTHCVHVLTYERTIAANIVSFLSSKNLSVLQHHAVEDLMADCSEVDASCLLMDLQLQNMSGIEIYEKLTTRPDAPSVIFVTKAQNVACAVRAIKAGAFEVLETPLDPDVLFDVVISSLKRNRLDRLLRSEHLELKRRYARLTKREREVLPLLLGGWLIKQSAYALGVAEITMQVHRSQVMKKMEAESIPDLVRMGIKLGIRHANSFRVELVPSSFVYGRPAGNASTS